MKRIIIAWILLLASVSLHAQTYIPFPTNNTIWSQRHGNGDTTPSYYYYGLAGKDSIINTLTYHELYQSVDTIFQASECVGGLREDSMRRVYFYDYATGHERLLYNFMVQPGDTVDTDPGSAGIVSSIDSIDISGVYHRRINFQTYDSSFWLYGSWVEGIGNISLGGLLGSGMLQPTCDCATDLICFMHDGDWRYHNPLYANTDCMPSQLSVNSVATTMPLITVYPNPVTGTGTIRYSGIMGTATLRIYTAAGTLLHQYSVNGSGDISISQYPAGMYFYNMQGSSGKFIVE
jgi:hypothetical protein